MSETQWQFDSSHGRLQIGTDVAGRAAKMGHRLVIAMERWQAALSWSGEAPTAVTLTVEVDSLRVLRGEGGLTPLSAPEKALIRSNALKCLDATGHGRIRFGCNDIESIDGGYRLAGDLEIHGRTKPHVMQVQVARLGGSARLDGGEAKLGAPHHPGGSARLDGGETKLGAPHQPGGSARLDGGETKLEPPHQPGGSASLDEGETKLGAPHQPGGSWRVDGQTRVRHSDFGVRRYSMLMGAMQVADEVTVSFSATVPAGRLPGS